MQFCPWDLQLNILSRRTLYSIACWKEFSFLRKEFPLLGTRVFEIKILFKIFRCNAFLPQEFSLLFNLVSRTSILLERITIKMFILIRILVLKGRICYLGNLECYKTITVLFEDRNPNCFMFWLLCCEYNKFSIDSGIQSQLFVSLSLPIKAWKFSGNLSDDEHVSHTASQVLWNWENIYSNMLISNQENPAKLSNMETNNGVNLKNWWIYTYQVLQFPMDSKIWTCFQQTGSADLSTKPRGLTIWL